MNLTTTSNRCKMKHNDDPGIPFPALILASGLSERMGRPKALLPWDSSTTFLEKILAEYRMAGSARIIVTVNKLVMPFCESLKPDPAVILILNEHPERGRLHSVKLGLQYAGESQFCFIQNVDNPFVRAEIILKILASRDPEYSGKGGHPVLLPKVITDHLLSENNPEANLQEILRNFPKKRVLLDDNSILRNINTPEDYRELIASPHCLLF